MGKRAAVSSAKVGAKKGRAGGLPEEAAPGYHQVLEIIRDPVLRAALPFALGEDARHRFQEQVLDASARALAEEESKRRAAVAEAEQAVEALDSEIAAAQLALKDAEQQCALLEAQAGEQTAAAQGPEAAAGAAEQALAGARAAVEAHGEAKAALAADVAQYEAGVHSLWEPLRSGAAGPAKEKNKLLAKLSALLQPTGAPQSLLEALQASLKQAPQQRGEFAQKALDAAWEAYRGQQERLAEELASFDDRASSLHAAVEEAEAALADARAAHAAALDKSTDAQNTWASSTNGVVDAQGALRRLPSPKQRAAALEEARQLLSAASEAVASFQRLRGGGPLKADEEQAVPGKVEGFAEAAVEATGMDVTAN